MASTEEVHGSGATSSEGRRTANSGAGSFLGDGALAVPIKYKKLGERITLIIFLLKINFGENLFHALTNVMTREKKVVAPKQSLSCLS